MPGKYAQICAVAAVLMLEPVLPASGGPYDPDLGQKIDQYLAAGGKGYARAKGGCATAATPNSNCPNVGVITQCHNVGCPPFPNPDAPLVQINGLGAEFFKQGVDNRVDPRFILAIAGQESVFGTYWVNCSPTENRFNAWNFFHSHTRCDETPFVASSFASYQAAIGSVSAYIRNEYLDKGFDTIDLIGKKYCQGIVDLNVAVRSQISRECQDWPKNVTTIYKELLILTSQTDDTTDLAFAPGCLDFWDADAVAGNVAKDLKGKHPGAMTGGVTVAAAGDLPGWSGGNSFYFDGTGFIDMGSGTGQVGTGAFSLEAWVLWTGAGSSINNVIRKSNFPVSGPGAGYWIRINRSAQTLEFFVGESVGGNPQAFVTASMAPNVLHHVVATKEKSGTITLYLDGQPAGTQAIDPAFSLSSSAPFTLGAWNDRFGVVELFSGFMDQIGVYGRALTKAEVAALFKAGGVAKCN